MKEFFKLFNLYSSGIEKVRELCESEKYDDALWEYRKILAKRFSSYKNGAFSFESENKPERADQLLQNKLSLLGYEPVDLGKPINWFLTPHDDKQWQSHLGYMYWATSLICLYRDTRDIRYLNKWIEIMDDFCDNHPWGIEGLEYHKNRPMYLNEYKYKCGGEGQTPGYLGGSWIGLCAASRIENWINDLSVVIGDENVPNSLIVKMITSLATEHTDCVINNARRYTPNQFAHGATELLNYSIIFWETKKAPACYLIGMQRLEEAFELNLLPDGADLEQSINYNCGVLRIFTHIYKLFNGETNQRVEKLKSRIIKRIEFLYDIADENHIAPPIAKSHDGWNIYNTLKPYEKAYGLDLQCRPYKSIAFPYGGYFASKYIGRYLFFKCSRLATGHSHEDCNSIILRLDGKPVLIDCSNYNYSDDRASMLINDYMFSTFGHNSVSVDGMSQFTVPLKDSLSKEYLESLSKSPIDVPYVICDEYDSFEGNYNGKYGNTIDYSNNSDRNNINLDNLISASHNRKVMYLKAFDVYVVVDTMSADEEHDYTVSWNISANYGENDVVISGNKTEIRKEGLPSLDIYSFSENDGKYEKFYNGKYKGTYSTGYSKISPCVHIEQTYHGKDVRVVHLLVPNNNKIDFSLDGNDLRIGNRIIDIDKFEVK